MGCEVYLELKKLLKKQYGLSSTAVGDEGGFAPDIVDIFEPLKLLS